jgi:hypothetical protein
MRRLRLASGLALAGVSLIFLNAGCSTTHSSTTRVKHPLCHGNLDEYRQIELTYDTVEDHQHLQLPRRYEQLSIRIMPRPTLNFRCTVETAEPPGGQLRFDDVTARTDASRQKVWFVAGDTGRVIATLDRATGSTTGPNDDPPAWADPNGGLPLESSSD